MTSDGWRQVPLGEVCEKIGSGATPRGGEKVYRQQGIPFVRSQNVYNDGFSGEGLVFIGPSHARELDNVEVREGDSLLDITGESVARTCLAPKALKGARVSQHVAIVRPDSDRLDSRFLHFALVSPAVQGEMLTLAGAGATRRALTKEMIQNLRVPFPPLADQRAIGSFLGSLDDKIALNRRMNSTLEQIAQGLFKSWFVDFNPVRAKREGRWKKGESLPGMPADMWDLWPSEFEDSELGEIPTGWTVLSLASVGCFLNGLACQRYPPKGQEWLPVLKIAELRAGSVKGADHASTSVPPEYVVDDGDLVFSWSGSLEVRFWHGGKAVLNQHLFKITSDRFPLWFCYGWILEHIDEFRAIASDKATTMGHIQRHHLQDALIAVPPPNIVAACDRMMAPEIEAITSNESQVRTLALLRDTLLPKLLSGEIRVPIDVG